MHTHEMATTEMLQWYVLRDLKRANSKTPAYKVLPELGFEIFTPMHWVLKEASNGRKQRVFLPFIPSLLFAKSSKPKLDEAVGKIDTLQYRFVKGAPQNTPMTVPMKAMQDFIRAVGNSKCCNYYAPDEITPDMIGKRVMIVGGGLEGTTGNLVKLKGSKKKRLILKLEGLIAATFEIESDYIQFI